MELREADGEDTKVVTGDTNPWGQEIRFPEVLLFEEDGKIVGAGSIEECGTDSILVRELRPMIPPFPYKSAEPFRTLEARESGSIKHNGADYPFKENSMERTRCPSGMPEVGPGAFGVMLQMILLHNPDLKQEAILHGMQGSASTFACPWCYAPLADKRRDGYQTTDGFKFPPAPAKAYSETPHVYSALEILSKRT